MTGESIPAPKAEGVERPIFFEDRAARALMRAALEKGDLNLRTIADALTFGGYKGADTEAVSYLNLYYYLNKGANRADLMAEPFSDVELDQARAIVGDLRDRAAGSRKGVPKPAARGPRVERPWGLTPESRKAYIEKRYADGVSSSVLQKSEPGLYVDLQREGQLDVLTSWIGPRGSGAEKYGTTVEQLVAYRDAHFKGLARSALKKGTVPGGQAFYQYLKKRTTYLDAVLPVRERAEPSERKPVKEKKPKVPKQRAPRPPKPAPPSAPEIIPDDIPPVEEPSPILEEQDALLLSPGIVPEEEIAPPEIRETEPVVAPLAVEVRRARTERREWNMNPVAQAIVEEGLLRGLQLGSIGLLLEREGKYLDEKGSPIKAGAFQKEAEKNAGGSVDMGPTDVFRRTRLLMKAREAAARIGQGSLGRVEAKRVVEELAERIEQSEGYLLPRMKD